MLEVVMQGEMVPREDLGHADGHELFIGIDKEIGVEDAAPGVTADVGNFGGFAGRGGNAKAETEFVAVVLKCALQLADLVARHLGDGFTFQEALPA